MLSKHEPSEIARNEKPALESRRVLTQPLTVAIREQLRSFSANIDVIAPAAFLQMVVPLIVFFGFQRYFVQGLLAGSQR